MSLLSRLLGIGGKPEDDEPESLRRISAELQTLEPERARYVASFACTLARVAHADLQVDAAELRQMESTLMELGGLEENEARVAVQIAVSQTIAVGGTESYRVTREFRRMTEKPERVRLMRCLLAVAAADDSISSDESREIVVIGEQLGLSRSETSALRFEYRDKLSELQKLDGER